MNAQETATLEATADRRLTLLLQCSTPLKMLRDFLEIDGLLRKAPGLDRIIQDVEAEIK